MSNDNEEWGDDKILFSEDMLAAGVVGLLLGLDEAAQNGLEQSAAEQWVASRVYVAMENARRQALPEPQEDAANV
jgi:hypothetical protein